MPLDERWAQFSPREWDAFAQAWIAELRDAERRADGDVGQAVIMMNFTASPEQQWSFILAAVAHASDAELEHIAAGPVEDLLGKQGDEYIDRVERTARSDSKFAQMLGGVWKNKMSDAVWERVQALRSGGAAELRA